MSLQHSSCVCDSVRLHGMAEWIGESVELEPVLDRNPPHPTALREAMKHGEAPKKSLTKRDEHAGAPARQLSLPPLVE